MPILTAIPLPLMLHSLHRPINQKHTIMDAKAKMFVAVLVSLALPSD
jgi:hypothetical protein